MFGNLGIHIIQFPSRRFGFVGSLPVSLGDIVEADKAGVLGNRAFWRDPANHDAGLAMVKFPSFDTEQAARDHAKARGIEVR